ncbi:CAP domain-containing protein [Clostridium sp. YIM B02555]|uniref:CAP domain-containing protein n=1 Tax=Clostridium sp. YIM B02555 TaxID=2911968 RepID=UPI001EEDFA91|nr:CAP domain-containing protein [Clostridium sp. YIM B02555]
MKKAFLKKIIIAVVLSTTSTALLPLGVSAEWRQNYDKTLSYTDGNSVVKGWMKISGAWYYFNFDGKMKTDWVSDNGTWYYMNNLGIMQTGWIKNDGKWYYLNKTGAMERGWIKDKEKWYYLDSSGAMQIGWIKDNGKWYYTDNSGAMQIGNINIGGKVYYLNESGELKENKYSINTSNSIKLGKNKEEVYGGSELVDISELPSLPQNYSISIQEAAENKILELMNQKRNEAGLSLLVLDNTLVKIARYKSNHMIQNDYFDHTTPIGENWTNWLEVINYKYTTTGENIAYNNYDSFELFNQWWNSPGHRANMMNASYTKVGIGVIKGNEKYMGTQTFSN